MRKFYSYIGHEICIAVVFSSFISLILKILDKKYIRITKDDKKIVIDILELNRFDDRIENKCQV